MTSTKEIEALAWRTMVIGFDGASLPSDASRMIGSGAGGVILFHRNIEDASQVRALTDSIHSASRLPVLISVDQEGGRVARLRGVATDVPPMRLVADKGPVTIERLGRMMAAELSSLGFDICLAPVADVDTNPLNPVIGDRAFSSQPRRVAKLAAALARGLEDGGVAACAKHFPGHGDTETDSHLVMPNVTHDRARLSAVELVPFAHLARAGIASVMTAHVSVESVDPGTPATMSARVLGLLRADMSYEGVVFSDDLEMAAVADHYEIGDAGVRALAAGCDQLLVCHRADRQMRVVEAITKAVVDGELPMKRLEEATARFALLARRFSPARPRPSIEDVLGCEAHLSFAESLFESTAKEVEPAADPTGGR